MVAKRIHIADKDPTLDIEQREEETTIPCIRYDDLMNNNLDLALRQQLVKYGYCVVTQLDNTNDLKLQNMWECIDILFDEDDQENYNDNDNVASSSLQVHHQSLTRNTNKEDGNDGEEDSGYSYRHLSKETKSHLLVIIDGKRRSRRNKDLAMQR